MRPLRSALLLAGLSSAATAAYNATYHPVLGAVGIGVSNLTRSIAFYTQQLGLVDTGVTYDISAYSETVLALPYPVSGSSLVLMSYKTPRDVYMLPGKLVFYVEDVNVVLGKLRAYGSEILSVPGTALLGGQNVTLPTGMARDPDGYVLELNPLSVMNSTVA